MQSNLISVAVPLITAPALAKLRAFAHKKPLGRESNAFDVGYERAKEDLNHLLDSLVPQHMTGSG